MAELSLRIIFVGFSLFFFCAVDVLGSFSVSFVEPTDCKPQTGEFDKYFDASLMKCMDCAERRELQTASRDGLRCVCQDNTVISYTDIKEVLTLRCKKCPSNTKVSEDGYECLPCKASCPTKCAPNQLFASGSNTTFECVSCEPGKSPHSGRDLNEDKLVVFLIADGSSFQSEAEAKLKQLCQPCRQFEHVGVTDCDCGSKLTGGVCFKRQMDFPSSMDFLVPVKDSSVLSPYLEKHAKAAIGMCGIRYRNATACQLLANMCALQYFSTELSACKKYRDLSSDQYQYSRAQEEHKATIPWMYIKGAGDTILNGITGGHVPVKFGVAQSSGNSQLRFRLAKYSLNGHFLGWSNVTGGVLQLCSDTEKRLDAAYVFGTEFSQSCEISALKLFDKSKYPLVFYDMYIQYTHKSSEELYVVPVLNANLKSGSESTNENARKSWILVRRFFMVDNVATAAISGGKPCGGLARFSSATYVRFPKSISFHIHLRKDEETGDKGYIFPPYLRIEYNSVSCADAESGATVKVEFKVDYEMDEDDYNQNFKIGAGIVGTVMVLFAVYRTWVWSKRAGRIAIDFLAIINFVFQVAGALAYAFFVLTFGTSFYWLVFYKNQEFAFIVLPEKWAYTNFLALLGSAFALKVLHISHLIFMQCTMDIFLIDWERPRSNVAQVENATKKHDSVVSVWRTYFVANEFNELQSKRKLSTVIQILTVVFFLEVVGFVNVSTTDGKGSIYAPEDEYHGPQNSILRFAVSTLVYLLVGLVQWIAFLVYNQFIENPMNSFVDLCSMCNVSVFIMAHAQYGHYVHGRSVHGKGDADLREMSDMMKREEEDLCGQRGLLPNQQEQTFEMSLPWKLRAKYDQMYLPVALEDPSLARGDGKTGRGRNLEKTVMAYLNMNRFLSAFIDHSLREIDYVVKDKSFLEKVLNTEFLDAMERGIFYNDNGHSFTDVLFYGSELSLIVFDLLCFSIVDLIAKNYILAGLITYILSQILVKIRETGGRRNLARKTMVDERFLI